ncbi:MAG: DUF3185 domain-containing protein [Acidobacteria bacterium]|nr:MAG: DUF3185 domain-containing protein [Acidobacteriota bacterium]
MRTTFVLGVVLIILGTLALAYQGFSYTTEEKIADIGPIEATAEKHERVSIPPLLGGAALAGGVILVLFGARRG